MRSFYLFKRAGGIYYVHYRDPVTKSRVLTRSTGKKDHAEAQEKAIEMLVTDSSLLELRKSSQLTQLQSLIKKRSLSVDEAAELQFTLNQYYFKNTPDMVSGGTAISAVPSPQKKSPALLTYLQDFWAYETSDYVQDKLSHGLRIGKRYCYEMGNRIKYWNSFFTKTETVADITTARLQDFEKSLRLREKKLSAETMNTILKAGRTAFNWAVRKKIITENPFDDLTAYRPQTKARGILTPEEAGALFKKGKWADERARAASLTAMTTGLRIGELLALRKSDIGDNRLYVRHSWSPQDGLKCPKNGHERSVPLMGSVRSELLRLLMAYPHRADGEEFIFWGTLPDRPVVQNVITDGFKQALSSIGIGEQEREDRNIVFHSWRHFYATTIADSVDERHAQLALGHLSPAMTKHYADHKREQDLDQVADISGRLFSHLLA